MPIGARNVSLLFSTASIKTTKTSSAVINISINTPCAMVVPGESEVFVLAMEPGNMPLTSAAALIAPRSCAGRRKRPRMKGTAPVRTRARVTWLFGMSVYGCPLKLMDNLIFTAMTFFPTTRTPLQKTPQQKNRDDSTYSRIKQPPTDPIKGPHIHQQTEPIH